MWVPALYLCVLLPRLTTIAAGAALKKYETRKLCPNITYEYTVQKYEERTKGIDNEGFKQYLEDAVFVEYPFWLADLREVLHVRSDLQRPAHDITLVSQSSLSRQRLVLVRPTHGVLGTVVACLGWHIGRISNLELQCQTWPGSIAVAVYIPIVNGSIHQADATRRLLVGHQHSVTSTVQWLQKLHSQLSAKGCIIDLAAYTEEITNTSSAWYKYPVNSLRNKAQSLVQTEMALFIDGDHIPGPQGQLRELLMRADSYQRIKQRLQSDKLGIVFPAFQTQPWHPLETQLQVAKSAAFAADKEILVQEYGNERIIPFQWWCHNDTDYARWIDETEEYLVEYQPKGDDGLMPNDYEPYLLMLTKDLQATPWDERLRGYYYNKQAYIYSLWGLGFRFIVHPFVFLIHVPHPSDLQKEDFYGAFANKERHIYVTHLPYKIRDGEYMPVVADSSAC